jgi:plasmid maintenance system antidote protein VapI
MAGKFLSGDIAVTRATSGTSGVLSATLSKRGGAPNMKPHDKVHGWFEETGIKLTHLARMAEVNQSTLQAAVYRNKGISLPLALKLFKPMGVQLEWLLDDTVGFPAWKLESNGVHLSAEQQAILREVDGLGFDDAMKRLKVQDPYFKTGPLDPAIRGKPEGLDRPRPDSEGPSTVVRKRGG